MKIYPGSFFEMLRPGQMDSPTKMGQAIQPLNKF
jgi:hypothetical protein